MRALAVVGPEYPAQQAQAVTVAGAPCRVAVLTVPDPVFEPEQAHRRHCLIRVEAFCCNYRDQAVLHRAAQLVSGKQFFVIGSEFSAVVEAVGADVTQFAPGDRVIADNAYPDAAVDGVRPGIPSNHGSRERQVLHACKLIRIPDTMDMLAAAGASIGGQTVFSMIRRLGVISGERVLVTSGGSTTAMLAIPALKAVGCSVHVITTRTALTERLQALGADAVHHLPRGRAPSDPLPSSLQALAAAGGVDAVIDPMFDVYLPLVTALLRVGGRYVTCGFLNQSPGLTDREHAIPDAGLGAVMSTAMLRNLNLMGNCLGSTADLQAALDAHQRGGFPVPIDTVITASGSDDGSERFVHRTFCDPERFGRVVYRYT